MNYKWYQKGMAMCLHYVCLLARKRILHLWSVFLALDFFEFFSLNMMFIPHKFWFCILSVVSESKISKYSSTLFILKRIRNRNAKFYAFSICIWQSISAQSLLLFSIKSETKFDILLLKYPNKKHLFVLQNLL